MISSVIIDQGPHLQKTIKHLLAYYCPYIQVNGVANDIDHGRELIRKLSPELLFFNPWVDGTVLTDVPQANSIHVVETIFILNEQQRLSTDYAICGGGYLQAPLRSEEFILAINRALYHILEKRQIITHGHLIKRMYKVHCSDEVIGIPTIEGYEFIEVNAIVRCEGLQKCTRVITTERSNIVSSYNLGEFIRLLSPFGFFSPHKSHLININMVRKYHREGIIYMQDGSHLPVARRRKDDFLHAINHL